MPPKGRRGSDFTKPLTKHAARLELAARDPLAARQVRVKTAAPSPKTDVVGEAIGVGLVLRRG